MGIRLEYACCFSAGPGSFVILSIGVISQMFFLGYYLLVTAVLASTEKLPFSPLLLLFYFLLFITSIFSRNIKVILLYYIIYIPKYTHYKQGLSLLLFACIPSRQRTLSVAYSLSEFPGSVNYELLVCPLEKNKLK